MPRQLTAPLNLHGVSLFDILAVISPPLHIHLYVYVNRKGEENASAVAHSSFLSCFRTVVKCNIAKSQALYSAQRGLKTNNAAVFKVGAIMINIPQHPATLHSMMVRSSHQLSKQISDLIRQPSNMYVCLLYTYF